MITTRNPELFDSVKNFATQKAECNDQIFEFVKFKAPEIVAFPCRDLAHIESYDDCIIFIDVNQEEMPDQDRSFAVGR